MGLGQGTGMEFLVANDDGIQAPGLDVLLDVLRPMGGMRVVAPADGQSAMGHSITCSADPIRVTAGSTPAGVEGWAVEGTPADCIRLGLGPLAEGTPRPDWVVSGINCGANLGVDVYYSGTVAAAREAFFWGHKAVAISQFLRPEVSLNWEHARRLAEPVLRWLFETVRDSGPSLWNINLPSLKELNGPVEVVIAPMDLLPADTQFQEEVAAGIPRAGTERIYRFSGVYGWRKCTPGADVDMVFRDKIAITPLSIDKTSAVWMDRIRGEFPRRVLD
ncbi:MAG TPA: 5'/3'-nucleotidase SurE [Verrucomicrobia bacterium]|nr:5'/3'-nucleotidase SurE [Verrucomicrobiota bacterium]